MTRFSMWAGGLNLGVGLANFGDTVWAYANVAIGILYGGATIWDWWGER